MSELVNTLTNQTGISSDLVHKGLVALLSFLKKELGDETFGQLLSAVPGAAGLTEKFESSPDAGSAGLFDVISGLASKFLGSKAADGASLLAAFSKLGFSVEQIEAFLPKAIELIKSYLPPDLLAKVLASLPALAKLATAGENKAE
jgi:Protein of unknown function VcgC/VcgE (DUF2780)